MSGTQSKVGKSRAPRVQITYDVETGGAAENKELPLVIGAIGEFSEARGSFRDRGFVNINKDNFNDIMASMRPSAHIVVDNSLTDEKDKFSIELTFSSMSDFLPDAVVQNVPELKALLQARSELSELRNRTASNVNLKERLSAILDSKTALNNSNNEEGA